jgi:hypothetical protein
MWNAFRNKVGDHDRASVTMTGQAQAPGDGQATECPNRVGTIICEAGMVLARARHAPGTHDAAQKDSKFNALCR